jgi:hypothetical protein
MLHSFSCLSLGKKISCIHSKILRVVTLSACVALLAILLEPATPSQPTIGSSKSVSAQTLVALQTASPTPSSLQRRTTSSAITDREKDCQREQAQWRANLPFRSLVTGALIFFVILVFVFTPLGFSTPFVRMLCAFVVAIVFGPTIIGLQKQASLRVCPEPTSFFGLLTADLFFYTLLGIVIIALLLLFIRYVSAVRTLNKRQTAS